jgi:asparagine synthase (glutamine-hydrolysing)
MRVGAGRRPERSGGAPLSGIVAVVGQPAPPADREILERMLAAMATRGSEPGFAAQPGAVLGAARHPWEGPALASLDAPTLVVAADATLYHTPDLVGRLGSRPPDPSEASGSAGLLARAYARWGESCTSVLEGDWSFVAYEPAAQRLFAARDFCGRRPLFYAVAGRRLVVASSVASILAHPAVPRRLDLGVVAAAAAGLFGLAGESAFEGIRALPPGWSLAWRDGTLRVYPHWTPPPIEKRGEVRGVELGEGADRLRDLIVDAVGERLDPLGPTAVSMSGGWDSTGVFGGGMLARRQRGRNGELRPVSIHYPPGDPGHEDDWIRETAAFWQTEPYWVDVADIPLLDEPERRAADRDEPFAHVFETWNRALARGARATGARVALDGVGGDHLFQVSIVALAELLRTGRWRELRREWRAKRMRGWKSFVRWAVLPLLSPRATGTLAMLRGGRPVPGYLERPVPPWVRPEFLRRHGLLDRERTNTPPRAGHTPVTYETFWYLTHPFGGRILSTVSAIALQEGVELRSPLMDRRIVEFALGRPWRERSAGTETKRLLRQALRGLVPDSVLAPRPHRTGTTSGYLLASLARAEPLFRQTFGESLLAEVGMIDAPTLRTGWADALRTRDENLAVSLVLTLQTELWLRARRELL